MFRFAQVVMPSFAAGAFAACGAPAVPTMPSASDVPRHHAPPQCADPKAQSRPLIVDWEASERADIEARARRGMVVVHADGCKLTVLNRCSVANEKYDYFGLTPKTDKIVLRDANELYANVPVYAADLEGKLEKSGTLEVAMVIVGQWDTAGPAPALGELKGECAEATHVVTALTVGSFEFSAGAQSQGNASATVLGAGAGTKNSSARETLSRDGDARRCEQASADDKQPPFGCGAVLRIEVVPLGSERRSEPTCAPGTQWDGDQCLAVKAGPACPGGQILDKVKGCVDKKPDVVPPRTVQSPMTSRGVVAVESDCPDVASCRARCDANDSKGCLGLGGYLRASLHPRQTTDEGQQAAAAFQKACDAGAVAACTALGEMRYQALGVPKDAAAALSLFKRACDAGDPPGCNDSGIVLNDRGDPVTATPYFQRACGTNSVLGCVGLGIIARDGRGRPADKAQAKELFQRACSGGIHVGCALASAL